MRAPFSFREVVPERGRTRSFFGCMLHSDVARFVIFYFQPAMASTGWSPDAPVRCFSL